MTKKFDLFLAAFNIFFPVLVLIGGLNLTFEPSGYGAAFAGAGTVLWFFIEIPFILAGLFLWIAHQTKTFIKAARAINIILAILLIAFFGLPILIRYLYPTA